MRVFYFSYPYSEHPEEYTQRAKRWLRVILNRVHNVAPICPHMCLDEIYNLPEGNSHNEILMMEIELIKRCDCLVYVKHCESKGVVWEQAIARYFGKPVIEVHKFIGVA